VIVDRPMSVGELADRTVTLIVRHWRVIGVFVLVEALPIGALRATMHRDGAGGIYGLSWLLDVALTAFAAAAIVFAIAAPDPQRPIRSAAELGRTWFLRSLGTSVATFVVIAPIAGVTALIWFGLNFGLTRGLLLPSFVGTAICVALFVVTIGPIIALVVGTAVPIALLENRTPFRAVGMVFRRSGALGFRRMWLLGIVLLVMTYGPPVAVDATIDAFPMPRALEPALAVARELFSDAVSLGLGIVLATVVAIETRIRTEGHDLALELQSATSASPTLTAPGVTTSQ
jgi:hypothetical protein